VSLEEQLSYDTVNLSVDGTSISAQSIENGSFILSPVPIGTYTITAFKEGFTKCKITDINVIPGQTTTISGPIQLNKPPEPPTGLEVSYLSSNSVSVTWDSSISKDVVGYNIYYGAHSDQINNKLNSSLITNQINNAWEFTGTLQN